MICVWAPIPSENVSRLSSLVVSTLLRKTHSRSKSVSTWVWWYRWSSRITFIAPSWLRPVYTPPCAFSLIVCRKFWSGDERIRDINYTWQAPNTMSQSLIWCTCPGVVNRSTVVLCAWVITHTTLCFDLHDVDECYVDIHVGISDRLYKSLVDSLIAAAKGQRNHSPSSSYTQRTELLIN